MIFNFVSITRPLSFSLLKPPEGDELEGDSGLPRANADKTNAVLALPVEHTMAMQKDKTN